MEQPDRSTPITKEEFIAEVDQLTHVVMDVIYDKRPDIAVVGDTLLRILIGLLAQVPEERRKVLRDIMHYAINIDVEPESVIDLSPQLRSAMN